MGIISKDITDIMSEADKRVAKFSFGLLLIPPLNYVLNHTKNVCNALSHNTNEFWDENDAIERVTDMMTRIYMYLQNFTCVDSVSFLKSIPFIYIKERNIFVRAENIVLDISERDEIPPYLYKASTCFENFFPVFEGHGAAKYMTCNHLAHILSEIWKKSKDELLHQDDRSIDSLLVYKFELETVIVFC